MKVEDQKRVPEIVESIKEMDLDSGKYKECRKAADYPHNRGRIHPDQFDHRRDCRCQHQPDVLARSIRERGTRALRAVGASRNHVRLIILGEASLIEHSVAAWVP